MTSPTPILIPQDAETYLLTLANLSNTQLNDPSTFSWTRLYNAYHILNMPHSQDRTSFDQTRARKGPDFPFYEQYLIHADTVDDLIDVNIGLAVDIGIGIAESDPRVLRRFRDATQDPGLASRLRVNEIEGPILGQAMITLLKRGAHNPHLLKLFAHKWPNHQNGWIGTWETPASLPIPTADQLRTAPGFPFMKLPPELRNKIYEDVLTAPWDIDIDAHNEDYSPGDSCQLLGVINSIHNEAYPIYFRCNTFHYSCRSTTYLGSSQQFMAVNDVGGIPINNTPQPQGNMFVLDEDPPDLDTIYSYPSPPVQTLPANMASNV
ncbi:MAG: hypothetical protein Q9226_008153 [Calogaya cf. arnoldii]